MDESSGSRALFYTILFIFVWACVELTFFLAYRFQFGAFSDARLQRAEVVQECNLEANARNIHDTGEKNWNVIHPYLGFVTESIDRNRPCPEEGYCDQRPRTYDDLPFAQSTDDNVIIAIIGGSFAGGVSHGAGPGFLEHQLRKIPRFRDKELIFYHLAVGGYKQPQQLLKINYFLTLGAEFDIIINIDGFNEVALPGPENLSKGVHPVFPRNWYYYVDTALNPELLALYGKREGFRLARQRWAHLFSKPVVNFLPSTNLIWKFLDQRLTARIRQTDVDLVAYQEDSERKMHYATTGPDYTFNSKDEFYEDMAEIWARSSLLLDNICRGQGIHYYHFLQPNQYVEGSKIMSEAEKKTALSPHSLYGQAAAEGYPFLQRKGKWLQEQGVSFHDLTMLFADTARPLYIDDCCHLNMPGYGLVINEIVQTIGNELVEER